MKEFCCYACRRYKKIELIGLVKTNKQKICTACMDSIKQADEKRIAEHSKTN